jgi:predicted CoA-binding protein
MKILFFGKSKRQTNTTHQIVKAFRRKGHTVKWINVRRYERILGENLTHRLLLSTFGRFKPDLVFVFSGDVPLATLEAIAPRTKSVMTYYEPDIRESHIPKARLVDYFFVTNRSQMEEYRNLGVRNPIFMREACDAEEHRRVPPRAKWSSDVAFIGKPANEDRLALLKRIGQAHDLKIWGPGDWEQAGFTSCGKSIRPKEYAAICSSAKIVLGCDRATGLESYFSNRTWLTLGCGGFLLTNYQPALEELFKTGEHLAWYRSEEECMKLIDHYLKHEDERKSISHNGYRLAHDRHTHDHILDEILSIVFP